MCRIAGIISKEIPQSESHAKVNLMCNALKHGGPDDEGYFFDENAGLHFGHRRLSIIDLSSNGHQPMSDVQQRAWITFNGEIYNYPELKELLSKAGHQFCSATDTEVILVAYLHWGIEAFSKLRGMFAFALYDIAQSKTYLVRDTIGIKPLYYHVRNRTLSFASEIRSFRQAGIESETSEEWKIRFLAYGHIPEPDTTLKNVFSLQKGSFLAWDHHTGKYEIREFKKKNSQRMHITDSRSAIEQIQISLRFAIKRQLIADAPIGVFLSGGIDSSIISLLANEQKKQDIKTISIYFNEKTYDERSYQNLVTEKISGNKFAHLVQQKDFEQHLPSIIADMDMPTTDGINSWFISKYAHEDGLKAVLSGLGADELFGGYPSFNRIKFLKYLHQLPSHLLKSANHFKKDKYRKIAFLANNHYLADYLLLRGLFVGTDIADLLDISLDEVNKVLFSGDPAVYKGSHDENHAAWFETNLYMQNQLLRDTDVMSMSHGLEVRVPFLDEDFQSLVDGIDPSIRFDRRQPKKLLIDSFSSILPKSTWDRPKMGFSFPLQQWMGKHSSIGNENIYRGAAAKKEIRKFKQGQMHWSKAFALYQIQLHG